MPFEIVQGDITRQPVDAIVNAANEGLRQGGGVCGAIFAAAGAARLQAACDGLGRCATGDAVITPGFDLPARYVIHTPGPLWRGGAHGEEALLRSCYRRSLELAKEKGLESIAFPLISAGIYGYPPVQALSVAVSAISGFLRENELTVRLVVYDRSSFRLPEGLRLSLEERLSLNAPAPPCLAAQSRKKPSLLGGLRSRFSGEDAKEAPPAFAPKANIAPVSWDAAEVYSSPSREALPREESDDSLSSLKRRLKRVEDGFTPTLLRLIDQRGKTDPEIYKRANLDRKLFSKIRSNPAYRPSKNTALALCVSLELNLDQTADLLRRAGYALSPASRADLIVEYFIRKERYDVYEINQALFYFDESLLGA